MTARYAVYYVPESTSPLVAQANNWLGRDAFAGTLVERTLASLPDVDADVITRAPRHYGFHATLKAPFELADGCTEDELLSAADEFAAQRKAFEVDFEVQSLGSFIALRLATPSNEMQSLHEGCVKEFDRFRPPISDYDLARRRKAKLSPVQDERLVQWGYPYIFDEFRFHMTLTGSIPEQEMNQALVNLLRDHFPAQRHRVDGIGIFKQVDREAHFTVLHRASFLLD